MSILSKLGFSRSERVAFTILMLALIIGSVVSFLRQRAVSQEADTLTHQDSILILEIARRAALMRDSTTVCEGVGRDTKEDIESIFPLDLNTASAEELELLPGIGTVLSKRIVDYRRLNGPFTSIDSLINVKGIGTHKLKKIYDKLTIGIPKMED